MNSVGMRMDWFTITRRVSWNIFAMMYQEFRKLNQYKSDDMKIGPDNKPIVKEDYDLILAQPTLRRLKACIDDFILQQEELDRIQKSVKSVKH